MAAALDGQDLLDDLRLDDLELADWLDTALDGVYPCATCKTLIVLEGTVVEDGNWIRECKECVAGKLASVKEQVAAEGIEDVEEAQKRFVKAQGKDKRYFARRFCKTCASWQRYSPKTRQCKCKGVPFVADVEQAVSHHIGKSQFKGRRSSASPNSKKKAASLDIRGPTTFVWDADDVLFHFDVSSAPKLADFVNVTLVPSDSSSISSGIPVAATVVTKKQDKISYTVRFNAKKILFDDPERRPTTTKPTPYDVVLTFPSGLKLSKVPGLRFVVPSSPSSSSGATTTSSPSSSKKKPPPR